MQHDCADSTPRAPRACCLGGTEQAKSRASACDVRALSSSRRAIDVAANSARAHSCLSRSARRHAGKPRRRVRGDRDPPTYFSPPAPETNQVDPERTSSSGAAFTASTSAARLDCETRRTCTPASLPSRALPPKCFSVRSTAAAQPLTPLPPGKRRAISTKRSWRVGVLSLHSSLPSPCASARYHRSPTWTGVSSEEPACCERRRRECGDQRSGCSPQHRPSGISSVASAAAASPVRSADSTATADYEQAAVRASRTNGSPPRETARERHESLQSSDSRAAISTD